jgi:hypothetical protein
MRVNYGNVLRHVQEVIYSYGQEVKKKDNESLQTAGM